MCNASGSMDIESPLYSQWDTLLRKGFVLSVCNRHNYSLKNKVVCHFQNFLHNTSTHIRSIHSTWGISPDRRGRSLKPFLYNMRRLCLLSNRLRPIVLRSFPRSDRRKKSATGRTLGERTRTLGQASYNPLYNARLRYAPCVSAGGFRLSVQNACRQTLFSFLLFRKENAIRTLSRFLHETL